MVLRKSSTLRKTNARVAATSSQPLVRGIFRSQTSICEGQSRGTRCYVELEGSKSAPHQRCTVRNKAWGFKDNIFAPQRSRGIRSNCLKSSFESPSQARDARCHTPKYAVYRHTLQTRHCLLCPLRMRRLYRDESCKGGTHTSDEVNKCEFF